MFTSLTAAKQLVEREGLRPMVLLEESAMEDFQGIGNSRGEDEVNSVVVGLAPSKFNYKTLNSAFRLVYIIR